MPQETISKVAKNESSIPSEIKPPFDPGPWCFFNQNLLFFSLYKIYFAI